MFSKIVLLAVVALAVCVVAGKGKDGGPKPKMGDLKEKMGGPGGEKKEGCWKKAKECCPSLKITTAGSWKACDDSAVTCKSDCAFDKSGLLSADKLTVDLTAVNAALDKLTTWSPAAIADAKAKCTATAPTVKPDNKKKCVTGAHDVQKCLMKALLPTCPDTTATTADCKRVIAEAVEKKDG